MKYYGMYCPCKLVTAHVRHQTRGGEQDDGEELGDDSKRVPEFLVVLLGSVGGCCGKEGLAGDEEERHDQKEVDAIAGADLIGGAVIAVL